ncbi:Bug family tripartite tricarboxylate transporter substrate binding protein [Roseomonas populi]|uniref:Tripartite tricarboxylate transporter substrate binding protein n=1 Tax=Roseomonas populi TaxID=3121582 RepID=A0ABT1XB80_9PROT|nr:tripartite tricarboxylate transporter substrate binding protein [Roseomonas pecuniae]MCR0984954.1 tripartite tricarboxylate transporter substrate binding protein [Roseomonas pecuniae]
MFKRRSFGVTVLGLVAGLTRAGNAAAQESWPARPVTVVVPWGPGGSTDTFARLLAARLAADLGKPFPIDNRFGANGTIGFASVARARPDGYTVMVATVSTYAMAPHLLQLPYDNATAFSGVGQLAQMPMFMVVPRSSPIRTLADYVAQAKRNPGRETYANSGAGSSTHLATELFLQQAGIQVTEVGYRGGGPATQAVINGEAGMVFVVSSGVMPFLQSGGLRALAVTTRERTPLAPEVPTFAELGFPEYEVVEDLAMLAPAGTPVPTLERLNAACAAAMQAPDVAERLTALAVTPKVRPASEWPAYLAAENAKWRDLIRSREIRIQ